MINQNYSDIIQKYKANYYQKKNYKMFSKKYKNYIKFI